MVKSLHSTLLKFLHSIYIFLTKITAMQTFIHYYANFFIKLNTLLNTQLQYGKFYNNCPFCNLSKNTLKQSIVLKKTDLIQREILSRARKTMGCYTFAFKQQEQKFVANSFKSK